MDSIVSRRGNTASGAIRDEVCSDQRKKRGAYPRHLLQIDVQVPHSLYQITSRVFSRGGAGGVGQAEAWLSREMESVMSEHRQATVLSTVRRIDHLPAATAFDKYPASWYLFGASRDLKSGETVSRKLFGRKLVGYRTTKGNPVIMDSRCSHLGADLTGGKVETDCIRCPFHGWAYGPDGRCVSIPNSNEIPGFARQTIFPVAERHGLIFVFFGAEALFPLPSFSAVSDDDLVAARPARFVADTSWYMVAAHGYDERHFETVHSRRLLAPLTVDRPATYARRSRYMAEIVGNQYYDRFLRSRMSHTVSISITTWGGTLVMISGDFGSVKSLFMIALEPLNDQQTLCSVVVFKQRSLTPVN